MITSTFPDNGDQTKPYPKIMRHIQHGSIVLFLNAEKGTVIHVGQTAHSIGNRVEICSPEAYEDYNGPVTLQNK